MFLSFFSTISAVFISILLLFNQLLILFFFVLCCVQSLLLFFRGEIIHQFLFSLHSCANNDRKKFCSRAVAVAGVFDSNGFQSARLAFEGSQENFSHKGVAKLDKFRNVVVVQKRESHKKVSQHNWSRKTESCLFKAGRGWKRSAWENKLKERKDLC